MQWQQVLVIRNSTVEGPLFQTILLNIFPIPKTGLYNLANTWKRQMTPLSREVTFSTNQWGCQRKRKIRTSKKEAQCITQHARTRKAAAESEDLSSGTRSDTGEETLEFISIFAKQRNGTSLAVQFTFWHQNALLLKLKNTGSWIDIFPKNIYRWKTGNVKRCSTSLIVWETNKSKP